MVIFYRDIILVSRQTLVSISTPTVGKFNDKVSTTFTTSVLQIESEKGSQKSVAKMM